MAETPLADPSPAAPSHPAAVMPVDGRLWLRPVGVTTLLALAAVLAIIVWPSSKGPDAEAAPGAPLAAGVVGLGPSALPAPVPDAPSLVAVPAEAVAVPVPPADVAVPHPPSAAGDVVPLATLPPPSEPAAARAVPSPRERCAGRSRYELLQCMQAQCAKKSLAQHEQCRLLREQHRLS